MTDSNALILPHYKENLDYHSKRISYNIPKEEQILFEIDPQNLNFESQTYSESHFANLMNISKKNPKNLIKEKKKEFERKQEEKRQEKEEIELPLNLKSIPIEKILKTQHFIQKTLNETKEEPKLGNVPSPPSKIANFQFQKSNLQKYPSILQKQEEIPTESKNSKKVTTKEPLNQQEEKFKNVNFSTVQQETIQNTFKPKKQKKESLLKRNKKRKQEFSFHEFFTSLKLNLKNFFPFLFNLFAKLLKINPFTTNRTRNNNEDSPYNINAQTRFQNL
jgi:hypothetical protein